MSLTLTRLTLIRPDDWHLHLRDGDVLASVLPDTARRFARAIVMPNLDPPIPQWTMRGPTAGAFSPPYPQAWTSNR
jgi:dihydroorotase